MWLIDLILNLAALLLWLKWRETKIPQRELPGISLASTLKRTGGNSKKPLFLLILLVLLIFRPVIYWQLGSTLNWTPRIALGVISLPFRSEYFWRIFSYSFLSFATTLGAFYLVLFFLSLVNGRTMDNDPLQRAVRNQLGWPDGFPWFLKVIVPWGAMLLMWIPLSWLLTKGGIIPPSKGFLHTAEQGAVLGIAIFSVWSFAMAAILFLYVLNSYIYFGNSPVWNFIYMTGNRLLRLIAWLPLRVGKVDFAPILLAILILILTHVILHGFWRIGGLVSLYQQLAV